MVSKGVIFRKDYTFGKVFCIFVKTTYMMKKSSLPPYEEALRYMANAQESLKKAGKDKETGEYEDKK